MLQSRLPLQSSSSNNFFSFTPSFLTPEPVSPLAAFTTWILDLRLRDKLQAAHVDRYMGGQVQQPNAGSYYDHHGSTLTAGQNSESADVALVRWLQSAGLQHLASPTGRPLHSNPQAGVDPGHISNVLMQDIAPLGEQSLEERQKLFRLLRSCSQGTEVSPSKQHFFSSTYGGSGRHSAMDGLSSPERRGDIGGGILDLHSMDDIELLSEHAGHVPFEASPFGAYSERSSANESGILWPSNTHDQSSPIRAASYEEANGKEYTSGLARIKVVVRKRPLNKKEISRKEEDIVTVDGSGCSLTVHEPKLKVDLTAYVEKHDFVFDAVLDEQVSNDEVYRETVEPIIPCIFQRTKATCFAYGQTGSGKTFTMQPLPLRACQDILALMQRPSNRGQGLQLWLSFFEIYGGKLYDLLNDRRKLMMREDGRQQVCIVGLKEFNVSDVELVKDYIEKGNGARSTGSTGANEESSRSHAILQLVLKKHSIKKEERVGKLVGKFSFIDLAGSERGADTTDNDRQTRIEGAEINKSLLALKECIRALDHEQGHIPFRGSKLTEVLRDSFIGDSRTVMISCISPNAGSCEHTLNTLRYADRVKGLSKGGNSKRDPSPSTVGQTQSPSIVQESLDRSNEYGVSELSRKPIEQVNLHGQASQQDGRLVSPSSGGLMSKENMKSASFSNDKEQAIYRDIMSNSFKYQRDPCGEMEQEQVCSPYRKSIKDDKTIDAYGSKVLIQEPKIDNTCVSRKGLFKEEPVVNNGSWRAKHSHEAFSSPSIYDEHITAILEEEEDLIAAHRLEVEDTMELVREEMKLLSEVDHPGSRIDRYISQLSYILSRKAAGIVNLQARLARFQQHLKEQDILCHRSSNIAE